MDPDEHLPWPDPALIQKWWTNNQSRFQKGTRCLLGKPMSIEWLRQLLRIGRQRQRAAAAAPGIGHPAAGSAAVRSSSRSSSARLLAAGKFEIEGL
jgi:hypothetical protein